MSYQVLARKYRPTSFDELEGQEHVLRALVNALEQNRLHHAYLFTGTRGVGKTTIARILARCLNCEKGVTARPCGECGSCREIAEGRSVDLIEVDAASRTKVEDTRDLLDNVQYLPTRARFKVYLIDEVHMLSAHSFNALLKTLEEPPDHVKFLFATTDPKKLPITVLSRCLQFNLKNLSPERIVGYLRKILPVEGIEFEEPALWLLGRAADGSMRDALSLTDQAISFGENRLTDADVRSMLGTIDQREVYALIDALIQKDAAGLLAKVAEMAEFGPDYEMLLDEMLSVLHRVAVAQAVPDGIDNSQGDKELVDAVAGVLPREDVQLYYQIGLIGARDLPLAPDPREGFEMVMLRMLAFSPLEDDAIDDPGGDEGGGGSDAPKRSPVSDILAKINSGSAPKDDPATAAAAAPERAAPEPTANADSEAALSSTDDPATEDAASTEASPGSPAPESSPSSESLSGTPAPGNPASGKPAPTEPAIDSAPAEPIELRPSDWTRVFRQLDLSGMTRALAGNCVVAEVNESGVVLTLDENHENLLNDVHKRRIAEAMSTHFGRDVQLAIMVGEVLGETPARAGDREAEEARIRAVEAIENDENVQRLIEAFDGKLNVDSVVPIRHAGE